MKTGKLIILRGPSGSGKSTIAKQLFKDAKKPTVLIEQDHYRFIFKPVGYKVNSKTIHKMIQADTLLALEDGYDVILEGIFTMKAYRHVFDEMLRRHPNENYIFLFDISFEETVRRHTTKPEAHKWGEKEMRGWYVPGDYSGYEAETVIPEHSSQQQTTSIIRKVAGL